MECNYKDVGILSKSFLFIQLIFKFLLQLNKLRVHFYDQYVLIPRKL